ncbi:hypothetical protein SVIOM342S_07747 [Streptomyces violaceorubidus]
MSSSRSAEVSRTVTTLRCSGDSELVVSRTSTPRSSANSGALTYETISSTTSSKTPLRADRLQHLHVVLGDLAVDLDVEADGDLARERGEDAAEALGERQARLDVLGDDTALHVDRVGDQLTGEGEADRLGDGDPPAFSWASSVEAPRCGVQTTWSNSNSGESVQGSLAYTSRPAPATRPSLSAEYSASSSTIATRQQSWSGGYVRGRRGKG